MSLLKLLFSEARKNIKAIFCNSIVLEYNGRNYPLNGVDVPGLRGYGKIVIQDRDKLKYFVESGKVKNISVNNNGEVTFLNGRNIKLLVDEIEKRLQK